MTELIFLFGFAFIAILLASVASGLIGSFVVVKRLSFLSGSIAHSILGGVGIVLWLKEAKGWSFLNPTYGAFVAAIVSALIIGIVYLRFEQKSDALIGAIWSFGMAIGVIFFSFTPSYSTELTHFLFGNILWVSSTDLWQLGILDFILVLAVGIFFAPLLSLCLDEEQAYIQGLSRTGYYLFLLSLISISIVILMQVIGIILVLALLTLPVMIAHMFVFRLFPLMLVSTCISAVLGVVGLLLAFFLNFPAGATIAVVSGLAYVTMLAIEKSLFTLRSEK